MAKYGLGCQAQAFQSILERGRCSTRSMAFHLSGELWNTSPTYRCSYIPGAKQVDGEIIETLWAPLNEISWSIRGMSLSHRQEVLDAHMNHSNWKKMVCIGMSVIHFTKPCMLIIGIPASPSTSKKMEMSRGWPRSQC